MKKVIIGLIFICPFLAKGQELNINSSYDWNKINKSGFYESSTNHTSNLPNNNYDWFWGINIAHSNKGTVNNPFHWGGQIVIPINRLGMNSVPQMYIRSTGQNGEGQWAKVLTDKGGQSIYGNLHVDGNIISNSNLLLGLNKQIDAVYGDSFMNKGISMGHYALKWLMDPDITGAGTLWMSSCGGMKFFTAGQSRYVITGEGKVGIGTENPQCKLDVAGTIRAKEVKIEATGWADHVFDKDYSLPSLQEVKSHIEEHRHLPGIPSEKEVLEDGINIAEMQVRLLQKIEELTIYIIQQDERIKELENRK